MLNIYHLQRRAGPPDGQAHSFIIAATSQGGARAIAASFAGDDWRTWHNDDQASCDCVGLAMADEKPGIILRAFRVG